MSKRFVVVGNPENRRVELFQAALDRLGLPRARVVSWKDVLSKTVSLADVLADDGNDRIVRIESPGENSDVERLLLAAGAAVCHDSPHRPDWFRRVEIEHGRIFHPRLWYVGLSSVLRHWEQSLPEVRWMNHPQDIARMFDKTACQSELQDRGIPVPPPLGRIHTYNELRGRLREAGAGRVFLKLPWGSSASGVVALRTNGRRTLATNSVEMATDAGEVKLYNSLKVRCYENEREISTLVDALARDGLHVERWLPKAGWRGAAFDLRIVVIAGKPCHVVMRTSHGPMTNLHLGNQRGDVAELLSAFPQKAWQAVCETCARAAQSFRRSMYLGLDVLISPGFRRHAVLEANAFGDLLPGSLHQSRDTYEQELQPFSGFTRD